jgi:hypothetical protein
MVQGGKKTNKSNPNKKNSKRKEKKDAPKRKHAPTKDNEEHEDELFKAFNKKVKNHQKKIYRSIEQTIKAKAISSREQFNLI